MTMKPWFFTFGCGQEHANKYVRIFASDHENARRLMFDHYGQKWSFQYDEKDFEGQPQEYGITELETLRESI